MIGVNLTKMIFDENKKNLKKLKELTKNLPPFPDAKFAVEGYSEYKMNRGDCRCWYLYEEGDTIGVHRWFNSKGTEFPAHSHEKEWIIVYKGKLKISYKNSEHLLSEGVW